MRLHTRFHIVALVSAFSVFVAGYAHGSADIAQSPFTEGMRASMQRDWPAAVERLSKAIEANPKLVDAIMERAAMYQLMDRVDEAIADYRRVLALKPDHYLALEYLAGVYEKKGAYSSAAEYYGKSLDHVSDPKWRSILKTRRDQALEKMKNGR